jgi:hypothetical protein
LNELFIGGYVESVCFLPVMTVFWAVALYEVLVAVAISILMQITVIYTPSFSIVFDTVPLSVTDWLIIIPLSSIPLIATELVKLWSGSEAKGVYSKTDSQGLRYRQPIVTMR